MRKRIKRGKILLKWHKGFTLYELIAVIIIIAVIALIGIPIVNQVIDSARQNALKDSAYRIIKSADIYYATKMEDSESNIEFDCSNNECTNELEKLDFKGKIDEGKVKIFTNGKISICIENKTSSAYKNASDDEVASSQGSCNYEGDDYSIDELVSLRRYNEIKDERDSLQNQIDSQKTSLKDILLDKGLIVGDNPTYTDLLDIIENLKDENSGRYYLYKDGNEYTSITGGWACIVGFNSTYHNQSTCQGTWLKKQTDYMQFYTNQTGSYYPYYFTLNKIDLSSYSYVGIEFENYDSNNSGSIRLLGATSLSPNTGYPYISSSWMYETISTKGYSSKTTITMPIISGTNSYLTLLFSHYYQSAYFNIYKIWLQ